VVGRPAIVGDVLCCCSHHRLGPTKVEAFSVHFFFFFPPPKFFFIPSSVAWAVCQVLKDRGLLAKPTRDTVIRLAPPLVMSDEDMAKCTDIISSTLKDIDNIDPSKLDQGH